MRKSKPSRRKVVRMPRHRSPLALSRTLDSEGTEVAAAMDNKSREELKAKGKEILRRTAHSAGAASRPDQQVSRGLDPGQSEVMKPVTPIRRSPRRGSSQQSA